MQRRILLTFLAILASPLCAMAATSVTKSGITWTFDKDYTTGQYVNGDWWVVGPVTITNISPRDLDPNDGVSMHGSVVNPIPGDIKGQGFDTRVNVPRYDPQLDVSRQLPNLPLLPGTSLLSTQSVSPWAEPTMSNAAVLTVVAAAPRTGSFRPPYAGTNKLARWNIDQVNRAVLNTFPRTANTPDIALYATNFDEVLVDIISTWRNSAVKARNNFPNYGREINHRYGQAGLLLNLDFTPAQKEKVMIGMIQHGIDIYGLLLSGMNWDSDGGHNQGRKLPMYLAARLLGDTDMLEKCDARKFLVFQEDQQHFFVEELDVKTARVPAETPPFTASMIGTPEWGGKVFTPAGLHHPERVKCSPSWTHNPYRTINGGPSTTIALAVFLMKGEQDWNRPAFFEYIRTRYYPTESPKASNNVNNIQLWVRSIWESYHSQVSPNAPSALRAD